jgi:hypothetical protein
VRVDHDVDGFGRETGSCETGQQPVDTRDGVRGRPVGVVERQPRVHDDPRVPCIDDDGRGADPQLEGLGHELW